MKAKKTGKKVFFIILALIIALTYTAFFGVDNYYGDTRKLYIKGAEDIRWGIDIRGGVEAVFTPDIEIDAITENDMASAKEIIETRLVNNNITDYEVFSDVKNKQIIVRFPWTAEETEFDPATAVAELGETALLTFCEGTTQDNVILKGAQDIEEAYAGVNETGNYVVHLEFTQEGTAKFAAATEKLLHKTISIWMDDTMISSPTVNTVITGGQAYIDGMSSIDEASDLANKINAGSLPFALTADDSKLQIISPSLGSNALQVMIIAGACAFLAICIIMILRYKVPGVVASLCLMGQVAAMIACVSGYFPGIQSFTLTRPGIAGIILSIGMGVDANVIAAERIKDEFEKGKTIDGAIDAGYQNSLSAIVDGNVTIVIVSLVLMGAFGSSDGIIQKLFAPIMSLFGSSITGSIYSFGYTLLVGVIFNMILGVYASKYMTKSISKFKALRKPHLFGGAKNV